MTALLLALLVAAPSPKDVSGTFRQGVDTYLKAKTPQDYLRAAEIWEKLVAQGVRHEDLFYNIGNAYYRAGRLGPAIYNYLRALSLDPDDPDARYNLNIARKLVSERFKDKVVAGQERPLWQRLSLWLDYGTLRWLFLGFWWTLFVLLGTIFFVRSEVTRVALGTAAGLTGVGALFFGLLLLGNVYLTSTVKRGVVLPDEVAVREAPRTMSRSTFRVHAGHEVQIRTEEGGWVKIGLANGMEGWVKQEDVGRL